MAEIQLLLGLMVAVAALGIVARKVRVPYPIVLVLGGLAIGLAPIHPNIHLEPEIVFLVFLPPLLYIAAFFTSVRDFKAEARPILSLAVGLVLATTVVVAAVTYAVVPQIGWAAAFALGAIVSPPDAVAATAIFRKVRVTRSVVTVLEGESMINDATGIVAYRFAVAAAVTGAFSLADSGARLVFVAVVGALIGLAVAWLSARLRQALHDPPVEITISLLTPFAAYLPADAIGASGVIAVVACGLYLGRQAPRIMDAESRLQGRAVWDTLVFILNGLVFVLIGLQLPEIVGGLRERSLADVVWLPLLVSGAVVLVRFAWVFLLDVPRLRANPRAWREDVIVSWAGMRGVVSLAAALALPFTVASGAPFPERDLLIFVTVCVIVVTLVGQGLSLPWLIGVVGLHRDGVEAHEEAYAREYATKAAQQRIDELAEEWPSHLPLIETLRGVYAHRVSHLAEHVDDAAGEHLERPNEAEQEMIDHRLIRHEVIEAERAAILELRDSGQINDDTMRVVERDLDLEEVRMEA